MYKYWILISFLAMLSSSISTISLKLIDKSKYDNTIFLALAFIFMGIISIFYLIFNKNSNKKLLNNFDKNLIIFVIGFAILLILNNYIIQKAFTISPNIAYVYYN